jgi:hypothetical protein
METLFISARELLSVVFLFFVILILFLASIYPPSRIARGGSHP